MATSQVDLRTGLTGPDVVWFNVLAERFVAEVHRIGPTTDSSRFDRPVTPAHGMLYLFDADNSREVARWPVAITGGVLGASPADIARWIALIEAIDTTTADSDGADSDGTV